jgi:hypothetical protein
MSGATRTPITSTQSPTSNLRMTSSPNGVYRRLLNRMSLNYDFSVLRIYAVLAGGHNLSCRWDEGIERMTARPSVPLPITEQKSASGPQRLHYAGACTNLPVRFAIIERFRALRQVKARLIFDCSGRLRRTLVIVLSCIRKSCFRTIHIYGTAHSSTPPKRPELCCDSAPLRLSLRFHLYARVFKIALSPRNFGCVQCFEPSA